MVLDIDRLLWANVRRKGAGIEVGEDRSDSQNNITGFNEFTHRLLHQSSVVHANIGWVLFVQCGLVS